MQKLSRRRLFGVGASVLAATPVAGAAMSYKAVPVTLTYTLLRSESVAAASLLRKQQNGAQRQL